MAAILLVVASRPEAYAAIVYVVAALQALHGVVHVLRYNGVVAGAEANHELDLRQGMLALVAALGLFLFGHDRGLGRGATEQGAAADEPP